MRTGTDIQRLRLCSLQHGSSKPEMFQNAAHSSDLLLAFSPKLWSLQNLCAEGCFGNGAGKEKAELPETDLGPQALNSQAVTGSGIWLWQHRGCYSGLGWRDLLLEVILRLHHACTLLTYSLLISSPFAHLISTFLTLSYGLLSYIYALLKYQGRGL